MSRATDFIAKIRPYAESAERIYGVPAAFLIAQAGIESAWGSDALAKVNNLFGVKAYNNWTGDTITLPADGQEAVKFRVYDTLMDCFKEQGKLLSGYYGYALAWKDHIWHYAKAVQEGPPNPKAKDGHDPGYCPNTGYADLILEIIDDFHLLPDWKVEFEKGKARAEKSGLAKPSVPADLADNAKLFVYFCRFADKGGKI